MKIQILPGMLLVFTLVAGTAAAQEPAGEPSTPARASAGLAAAMEALRTIGRPAQGPQNEPSTLTVEGSSEVRVAPDVATVRLGIVEQSPTAAAAQQAVNAAANAILTAVRNVGIDDRHIQTARLVLTPIYASRVRPEDEPRIVAYRASNTVSVRVEDLDRVGPVIDAGLGAGANQLEGVFFALDDDLEARQSALRSAVTEARSKAEVIADALGARLGPVLAVNEGGVSVRPPMMDMARTALYAMQESAPTPVSPGEVTIFASVTVQFELIQ